MDKKCAPYFSIYLSLFHSLFHFGFNLMNPKTPQAYATTFIRMGSINIKRGAYNQFIKAKCFNPDDDTQNDKLSHITHANPNVKRRKQSSSFGQIYTTHS